MRRICQVHWLCNSPTPYNAQLFRKIAADEQVDLVVHYRHMALQDHPWRSKLTEGYAYRSFTECLGIDLELIRVAFSRWKGTGKRGFVVAGWNHPTAWLLLIVLGMRREKFVVWTDTPDSKLKRSGLRQKLRFMFLRWVFRRADYVMGTGKPALKVLEKMGVARRKLLNFPYWIDTDRYLLVRKKWAQRSRDNNPIVFISSGIIQNNRKGHDVVIRALSMVLSRIPKLIEYRVAGTGPDEKALLTLAENLGLGDCIKFLGWLEPEELIEEMVAADVLIHPSPVHEPYGVSVIEGMAAGLPVLASDVTCAALDRVIPGVNGMIHRAGVESQLAEQIMELVADRRHMQSMSEAASRSAAAWPIENGVALIKKIFNE